ESGGDMKAIRRMRPEWAWSLKMAAERAGTAFFFKQWGNWSEQGIWRTHFPKSETLAGKKWHEMPWD
ncbi:MAG: DUF5131 family protein, partial [Verrucomicrobiaceae bacterium]